MLASRIENQQVIMPANPAHRSYRYPGKRSGPHQRFSASGARATAAATPRPARHSHSMVPGGLLVQSSTTRLTSGTELVIRLEMRARTS